MASLSLNSITHLFLHLTRELTGYSIKLEDKSVTLLPSSVKNRNNTWLKRRNYKSLMNGKTGQIEKHLGDYPHDYFI